MTLHGRAELFDTPDLTGAELRQVMLDHYLPKVGPDFETWLDNDPQIGARIISEKIFTFSLENEGRSNGAIPFEWR